MSFKLISGLLIAILVTIFSAQNYQLIQIKFITWQTELPLIALIFICIIIGAIFVALHTHTLTSHLKHLLREKEKEIDELKKQSSKYKS
jgi:uncharacterized integral membrane protein